MAPPWMLKEILGMPNSDEDSDEDEPKRVAHPTNRTPTTFNLNWEYCENGSPHPQPCEGVSTFIGPSVTAAAGRGLKWPLDHVSQVSLAVDILRKQGYTCDMLAGFDPSSYFSENPEDADEYEAKSEKEKELVYIKQCYDEEVELKKDNEAHIWIHSNSDGIYIRCGNEKAASIVSSELFSLHYALGRVVHDERIIESVPEQNISIIALSGNGENCANVTTMFMLKKGEKVISRALCSYMNGEMDNAGPTIELLETAAEWQKHGYGEQLLDAMTTYFQEVFEACEGERIKYNVCQVTNMAAFVWFTGHGFRDWDGMGEELGRYLFEY